MADTQNTTPDINVSVPVALGTPPVDTHTTGFTSGTTQSQITPTPESQAALGELDASSADLDAAGKAKGEAIETAENAKADAQGAEADRQLAHTADFAADQQSFEDRVAAAREAYDKDLKALKDYKFHDFFHDADGDRKMGRSLLSGIGSIFAGLSAAPGSAAAVAQQHNDMISRDFDLQRQQYSKLLQERKESGEDVDKLYSEWERHNAASLQKEALARDAYAAHALEVATRSGIPLSVAENSLAVAGNRQKSAQLKAEAHGRYDKSIQAQKTFENKRTEVINKPNPAAAQIEESIVRDPKTGVAKFVASGGPKAAPKQIEDYRNLTIAEDKMQKYVDWKEAHPGRAVPGTDEAKMEAALYADALAGNISTTTMPANKESMDIEAAQLGPSGALDIKHPLGWVMGPNIDAVKNRLGEIREQRGAMERQFQPLPAGYVDRAIGAAAKSATPGTSAAPSAAKPAAPAGVVEGSTSVAPGNIPIVFKGGKWVKQ